MDVSAILRRCDHTLLNVTATWPEIKQVCDDGIKYSTASICIPPSFVKMAKEYVGDKLRVCTVIGFPNGYNTTSVKEFETKEAIKNGADEIDMVINIGQVKEGNYEYVLDEIRSIKKICADRKLKVIIETCLLTEEEKINMCKIVTQSGAEYIKTSTGFSTGGASREDVKLLRANVGANLKVKASGGISSLEDAEEFLNLGARRLGTSKIVKIAKELENV